MLKKRKRLKITWGVKCTPTDTMEGKRKLFG